MVEVVGIIATLFVLTSFILNGENKIRIVNIIGAVIFVVYGLLLGAISVWLLNSILVIIHIYKLYKSRRS